MRLGCLILRNGALHTCLAHFKLGKQLLLYIISLGCQGFPVGKAGRLDSYGMLGMRERADAIGAALEFESVEGRGTTVRCRLENE